MLTYNEYRVNCTRPRPVGHLLPMKTISHRLQYQERPSTNLRLSPKCLWYLIQTHDTHIVFVYIKSALRKSNFHRMIRLRIIKDLIYSTIPVKNGILLL